MHFEKIKKIDDWFIPTSVNSYIWEINKANTYRKLPDFHLTSIKRKTDGFRRKGLVFMHVFNVVLIQIIYTADLNVFGQQ